MSGGSYNYLCHVEPLDLAGRIDDLEAMRDRLQGLGYADDAASATQAVLDTIRRNAEEVPGSHEWDYLLQEEQERVHQLEDEGAQEEARSKITAIERVQREIGALSQPLYSVWRQIEWWDSLDSGEDDFKRALTQWRARSLQAA
jgi:hypothetical protein